MDNLALAIGVLAGLVQLAGYWQYNRIMSRLGNKPNASSWLLWGIGGATEFISFASLADGFAKKFLPAVCGMAAFYVFVRMWRKERRLEISKRDWWIVRLDLVVSGAALISPIASNVLLGIDATISFWPILTSTWEDPRSEHPTPWRIWTLAYSLLAIVVLLQWESVWELIYPVSYLALSATVWWLSTRKVARA